MSVPPATRRSIETANTVPRRRAASRRLGNTHVVKVIRLVRAGLPSNICTNARYELQCGTAVRKYLAKRGFVTSLVTGTGWWRCRLLTVDWNRRTAWPRDWELGSLHDSCRLARALVRACVVRTLKRLPKCNHRLSSNLMHHVKAQTLILLLVQCHQWIYSNVIV